MKRLVLLTLVCLLLGITINTLIAWTCALWSPIALQSTTSVTVPAGSLMLDGRPFPADGVSQRFIRQVGGVGCEFRLFSESTAYVDPDGNNGTIQSYMPRIETTAGWPLRTWTSESTLRNKFLEQRWSPDFAAPLLFNAPGAVPASLPVRRGAPLRPKPLALIAMSLPFAAIGPGILAVKRHRRRRSGRCLNCGYQAAPLPTCPECGADQTRKRQRPAKVAPTSPSQAE